MERKLKIVLIIISFIFPFSYYLLAQTRYDNKSDWINVLGDVCIYDNNNHAAFTSMVEWNGCYYIAFREASSHLVVPNEYGIIRVLVKDNNIWRTHHVFHVSGLDMRDPCLVKLNNRLLLHSSDYYSELLETGWTDLQKINHNARHSVYIWKIREYNGNLYGVGNYNKCWPLLLKSSDGKNWSVINEFKIGGNATEADLLFSKDDLYICFRVESPDGSNSMWGHSKYPFETFKWSQMDISVASPEMINYSKNIILLSGRETVSDSKGVRKRMMSLFAIDKGGNVLARCILDDEHSDVGYPGFCKGKKGRYFMSYYVGDVSKTQVKLLTFEVEKKYLR